MTDTDVHLPGIMSGDAQAFARWMSVAEPEVRSSLRRFAASVDAEAVVQETLLRVWQVAPRFRADGRPNGLLRLSVRIAHNLALSETRKRRDLAMGTEGLEANLNRLATGETRSPGDPHLRRAIHGCRDKLPAQPAKALDARLASEGGMADADLAQSVGMKLNTFLQNFSRARKLLAECLRKAGVDIEAELA